MIIDPQIIEELELFSLLNVSKLVYEDDSLLLEDSIEAEDSLLLEDSIEIEDILLLDSIELDEIFEDSMIEELDETTLLDEEISLLVELE